MTAPIRWIVLLGLLALAAWLALFGDKTPSGAAVTHAAAPATTTVPARATPAPSAPSRATAAARAALAPPEPIETLLPRDALAATARGAVPDLFATPAWMAPPAPAKTAPVAAPAATAVAQAAPSAPPPVFNYRFIGQKREDGAWEVYLARDDFNFIAREGQTLESDWRVDKIAPPTMTLTHVATGRTQTLAIGENR